MTKFKGLDAPMRPTSLKTSPSTTITGKRTNPSSHRQRGNCLDGRDLTTTGRPTVLQHDARFRFPCFLHRRQGMLGKG